MKAVVKSDEPKSLTEHRLRHGRFDEIGDWKADLQAGLLSEQGGLCCYCMSRIERNSMKVEHLRCQERHGDQSLDYDNLLAACKGGEGKPRDMQHCDTHKANEDISLDPTAVAEHMFRFLGDGRLECSSHAHRRDVDDVLNLNVDSLVRARKDAFDACFDALREALRDNHWSRLPLERFLQRWQQKDKRGNFRPYVQVGVYLLNKKIRSLAGQ